jgi:hypothetical protein
MWLDLHMQCSRRLPYPVQSTTKPKLTKSDHWRPRPPDFQNFLYVIQTWSVVWLGLNKQYETNHSAYGPVVTCNRKQGHYSDSRIGEKMALNENHCNPATSTYLSEVCLVLKSPHTQNMLLRIESSGRYTHLKQVKVAIYYYIEKESWRLQNQNHHVCPHIV